jgi:hypothetical protein
VTQKIEYFAKRNVYSEFEHIKLNITTGSEIDEKYCITLLSATDFTHITFDLFVFSTPDVIEHIAENLCHCLVEFSDENRRFISSVNNVLLLLSKCKKLHTLNVLVVQWSTEDCMRVFATTPNNLQYLNLSGSELTALQAMKIVKNNPQIEGCICEMSYSVLKEFIQLRSKYLQSLGEK